MRLRLVRPGAIAPEPVPDGEVWLDVGNRLGPCVFDHHGGAGVDSATEAVFRFHDQFLLPWLDALRTRGVLVLHDEPDCDSLAAAWLARWIVETGAPPSPLLHVRIIVEAISQHDQGWVSASDPFSSWPIVYGARLTVEHGRLDASALMAAAAADLDRTLCVLGDGGTMADAAASLLTPAVTEVLSDAAREYEADLRRSEVLSLWLPMSAAVDAEPLNAAGPRNRPLCGSWRLVDGLFLSEPRSALFRELARGDKGRAPRGEGFPLLAVSRTVGQTIDHRPRWRHIISTDPAARLCLVGLATMLEAREQAIEDSLQLPLLPERERLASGAGRHGYNVASPWYDGRGHAFTIVDSPSVGVGDTIVCGSLLTPDQMLAVLREYSSCPGRLSPGE